MLSKGMRHGLEDNSNVGYSLQSEIHKTNHFKTEQFSSI